MQHCDVVVVGMGTCGEDVTLRLTKSGLDVVGVEGDLIGGECPFWACLPTKSLVRSASLVQEARRAHGLIGQVQVETDWSIVARRLREEVTGGWDDANGQQRFEARGGRLLRGWGRIVAPRTVQVGDTMIEARLGVILATGSRPFVPPIPGLSEVQYWTNREAVAAETLPASLAILGGGPVGVELGQVFARFGVDVTIVEGQDRLLANEEPEVSAVLGAALNADGVSVEVGSNVVEVTSDGHTATLVLDRGDPIRAEKLLVATGRRANADELGVDLAGASTSRGFVKVDEYMKAAEGLWAIGDVTGKGLLTEVALYQANIAVEGILGGTPRPADYTLIPRAVFTDPELGAVGITEAQALGEGRNVKAVTKDLQATFRGWLHRIGNEGVIKLIADFDEDRLVGASVVGPTATDVLGFLALAIETRVSPGGLAHMIYAFPSFYGALGEALGAYGRGVTRVLDPDTQPMTDDPGQTV